MKIIAHSKRIVLKILGLTSFIFATNALATPPEYATFDRDQQIQIDTSEDDILRIWMVYVGQGDGILIQLPKGHYESESIDWIEGGMNDPTVDIAIDAGSFRNTNADNMSQFLQNLYPGTRVIEHYVISHHDSDHVKGLKAIMEDETTLVGKMYHNGLASYLPGKTLTPNSTTASSAPCSISVCITGSGEVKRTMGKVENNGDIFSDFLIDSLSELISRSNDNFFHGVYNNLANAVIDKDEPTAVSSFNRVHDGDEIDLGGGPVSLDFIWPRERPRQYGGRNWGETINGNSVTLKLQYGDFQMLFTGDHNEHSEEDMIEYLDARGRLADLESDVLKVPHHGSSHALEAFFRHPNLDPVISVASMGRQGFLTNWKHPAENVIRWSGRSHRFYSTFIHEKRFRYEDLEDNNNFDRMLESTHILIETDGTWFRVVEIPASSQQLLPSPPVSQVRRSNGTRWICASGNC